MHAVHTTQPLKLQAKACLVDRDTPVQFGEFLLTCKLRRPKAWRVCEIMLGNYRHDLMHTTCGEERTHKNSKRQVIARSLRARPNMLVHAARTLLALHQRLALLLEGRCQPLLLGWKPAFGCTEAFHLPSNVLAPQLLIVVFCKGGKHKKERLDAEGGRRRWGELKWNPDNEWWHQVTRGFSTHAA